MTDCGCSRFSTFNGRKLHDFPQFELTREELDRISSRQDEGRYSAPLAALYHLFLFDVWSSFPSMDGP